MALSASPDRGEADRARAVLLTQVGWTSSKIAEAFGVRVDTVRLPARRFHRRRRRSLEDEGRARPGSGEEPSGLARGRAVLEAPVADRANWTIPRLRAEIEARESVRISRSQLSKALRKKTSAGGRLGTC